MTLVTLTIPAISLLPHTFGVSLLGSSCSPVLFLFSKVGGVWGRFRSGRTIKLHVPVLSWCAYCWKPSGTKVASKMLAKWHYEVSIVSTWLHHRTNPRRLYSQMTSVDALVVMRDSRCPTVIAPKVQGGCVMQTTLFAALKYLSRLLSFDVSCRNDLCGPLLLWLLCTRSGPLSGVME